MTQNQNENIIRDGIPTKSTDNIMPIAMPIRSAKKSYVSQSCPGIRLSYMTSLHNPIAIVVNDEYAMQS